jgi:Major Facilitator Superfamily
MPSARPFPSARSVHSLIQEKRCIAPLAHLAQRRGDGGGLQSVERGLPAVVRCAGNGVAYAAMLVLGGRLGDRFGRHWLFEIGAAGFVAASALCGLSPDIWVLVVARVIQGIFAAMLAPQALACDRSVRRPMEHISSLGVS